jgi:uncharacterized membrane protein
VSEITHARQSGNISEAERWVSVIAGGALTAWGVSRFSKAGLGGALLGAELMRRGITGYCPIFNALGFYTADRGQGAETTSVPYEQGMRVEEAITVNKPRQEVYRLWRKLDNLPRFMRHLDSVQETDDRRSVWVAAAPAGRRIGWEAEINNEIEGELIGFRSLAGSRVDLAGSVRFKDAPFDRGTEILVKIQYNPPAGLLGALAATLWGEGPSRQVHEDLHRFKSMLEAGEIVTTTGQPAGGGCGGTKVHKHDEVVRASEASFPASDAPAWR